MEGSVSPLPQQQQQQQCSVTRRAELNVAINLQKPKTEVAEMKQQETCSHCCLWLFLMDHPVGMQKKAKDNTFNVKMYIKGDGGITFLIFSCFHINR